MPDSHILATFLAQLVVLMVLGRALGEVMARFGQPAIFGQLLAGVALGPSLFGLLLPDLHSLVFPDSDELKTMINAISQVGILLLLLLTGMETNVELVRRRFRVVAMTSLSGIAVPFACGLALGFFLPDSVIPDEGRRLVTALFIGTALSISSVKIVAMVLMEVGFIRRDLGQLILATAILDDSIAWIIVSVIAGMASREALDITRIGLNVGAAVIFLAVALTIGRRLVAALIRWTNDNLSIDFPVITAVLAVTFAMALTTDLIGVHSALGAFIAGVIIGQAPILKGHIEQELRGLILAFFSPVFFAVAGLEMDLTTLASPAMLGLAAAFVLIASLGKTAGALAGGHLAGLSWRESLALATGLNARGSTEVIIATIGISLGVLSEPLYTLIVAMAIITTMAMPPTLRWTLSRVETRPDEQERLDEEEAKANDILSGMERALLIAEAGPNGEMAARLAGIFAADRQMLTTALERTPAEVAEDAEDDRGPAEVGPEAVAMADDVFVGSEGATLARASAEEVEARVEAERSAADAATKTDVEEPKEEGPEDGGDAKAPQEKDKPARIPLDTLIQRAELAADIRPQDVAAKGYSILFCGTRRPFDTDGRHFVAPLKDVLDDTDLPAVIALARGVSRSLPRHLLVPIDGTHASRLASEIAASLARATDARLTFLHIYEQEHESTLRRGFQSRQDRSVLHQADAFARRHGVVPTLREMVDRHPHRLIRRTRGEAGLRPDCLRR